MWKQIASFLLVLINVVSFVNSLSYEEDTRISGQERDALIQFKAKVIPKVPKSSYIQNYIQDDLYWIHWLRAKRHDIRRAEEHFLNHLKWREQENIDTIHKDNIDEWAEFEKAYPTYYNDTVDKTGRPVGEIWFGEWDVRQAVLSGRGRQVPLLFAKFMEMLNRRLFKARAEGKKVSQAQYLVDLENFNLVQAVCPACIPVIARTASMLDLNYPYIFDDIMLIKIPQSFSIVLTIIRPVLGDAASKALKLYPNPDQWMKALDDKIDRSQRSVRLGGTIVRDRD